MKNARFPLWVFRQIKYLVKWEIFRPLILKFECLVICLCLDLISNISVLLVFTDILFALSHSQSKVGVDHDLHIYLVISRELLIWSRLISSAKWNTTECFIGHWCKLGIKVVLEQILEELHMPHLKDLIYYCQLILTYTVIPYISHLVLNDHGKSPLNVWDGDPLLNVSSGLKEIYAIVGYWGQSSGSYSLTILYKFVRLFSKLIPPKNANSQKHQKCFFFQQLSQKLAENEISQKDWVLGCYFLLITYFNFLT